MQKKQYRIFCVTENVCVFGTTILDNPISVCPNNAEHEIIESSLVITDVYSIDNLDAVTNPTVNDDVTLGYVIGSRWINSVTSCVYVCTDNSVGAAKWKIKTSSTIQISCGGDTNSYISKTNITYSVVRQFIFGGTNNEGNPQCVKYLGGPAVGSVMCVRLFDVSHNAILSVKTDITTIGVHEDMNLTNWPIDESLIEIQMCVSIEEQEAFLYDVILVF